MTRWAIGLALLAVVVLAPPARADDVQGIHMDRLRNGRPAWPLIWRPYTPAPLAPVDLENGPLLRASVTEGSLRLSVAEFLRLVVENDLALQNGRYDFAIAELDVLRARSGQAARGLPNAPLPGAVFAGAIGAAVNTTAPLSAGGTGGVAISTQGKLVSFGARGNFDPTINVNFSYDRLTNPLNTTRVAGSRSLAITTGVLQTRFQQQLPIGTSYSVSFNLQRQASTQSGLLFNPALSSFGAFQVYQPLLNGFGRPFTQRFVTLAENNTKIVRESFHGLLNDRLSAAINAYWDLVALRETRRFAQEALAAADRQHDEDLQRIEFGVMSPLDALTSESQLANARVQLLNAETDVQRQEVVVKAFISKDIDPRLGDAVLEPTESLPDASDSGAPSVGTSIARALERRSSIRQAELTVQNQKAAQQYTRKNLLPVLSAYLAVDVYGLAPGTSPAVRQLIQSAYPEYSVGVTWSLPVFNRAAQADDVRATLETRESEAALQRARQQVTLQVQNATTAIEQNRARVRASKTAVEASRVASEGEQERLRSGVSTPYRVLQSQRDLTAAEAADVQARVNYAKAIAAYDVSVSGLLDKYGIDADAAERGALLQDR